MHLFVRRGVDPITSEDIGPSQRLPAPTLTRAATVLDAYNITPSNGIGFLPFLYGVERDLSVFQPCFIPLQKTLYSLNFADLRGWFKCWENWERNGVSVGGGREEDVKWDGRMAIERQCEGNTE